MRTFLRLLLPLGLGALFLARVFMLQGCTAPREIIVEAPFRPDVSEAGDYSAVAVMDCGELKYAVFTGPKGTHDPIKVDGPASLLDTKLRLGRVNYNRVFVFENDRPCGYEPDSADAL
jgi:hypothetical protein